MKLDNTHVLATLLQVLVGQEGMVYNFNFPVLSSNKHICPHYTFNETMLAMCGIATQIVSVEVQSPLYLCLKTLHIR